MKHDATARCAPLLPPAADPAVLRRVLADLVRALIDERGEATGNLTYEQAYHVRAAALVLVRDTRGRATV